MLRHRLQKLTLMQYVALGRALLLLLPLLILHHMLLPHMLPQVLRHRPLS